MLLDVASHAQSGVKTAVNLSKQPSDAFAQVLRNISKLIQPV
jgi:hypothetical protein